MKNLKRKFAFGVVSAVSALSMMALSGCTFGVLADDGAAVGVATVMTASEAEAYVEVGEVSCEARIDLYVDPAGPCTNDLRNDAARLGASIVVIEASSYGPCLWPDQDRECYRMHARAYR